MKKIIKFLPAMAILLGSSLAVASHVTYNAPDVKNANTGTGTPIWVPLQPGEDIDCNLDTARECLAHDNGDGSYSDIVYGFEND